MSDLQRTPLTAHPAGTERPVVVKVEDVTKRFIIHQDKSLKERVLHPRRSRTYRDDFWALNGVSLEIEAGSTIGLIGPNGSGKSTLLKTIGGIIEPTSGTIQTRGRMAALLELGAGFHPDLTGRENVYLNAAILGMTRQQTDALFDEIVEFSGIERFIDTQVKFYSSGMYVRLAFAVAINVDPDILLVDEVLAVGDEAFQKKCLDKIKQFQEQGRTIILVSHSLSDIRDLCTRAVVLGKGSIVFDGNPADAVSVLRAGFETRHEAEAAKESLERERAREAEIERRASLVAISDVRTTVLNPNEAGAHQPGGDLQIEVDLDLTEEMSGWDLAISLVNSLGTTATSTSTCATGQTGVPSKGKRTVTFLLPNLAIGQGQYSITAAFFDNERHLLTRVDELGKFECHSLTDSVGPVYTAATTRVE